jgi:hypothetical protein
MRYLRKIAKFILKKVFRFSDEEIDSLRRILSRQGLRPAFIPAKTKFFWHKKALIETIVSIDGWQQFVLLGDFSRAVKTGQILISPLATRDSLPSLLNFLKLEGMGVEIGVYKGDFSELLLKHSRLSVLYSIDPWWHLPDNVYQDVANVPDEEAQKEYEEVAGKLKEFGQRSKILRMLSNEAVKQFSDESLDFVYIDANHSYEACREDLALWWPKLKAGGVFAGHDYLDICEKNFGVKSAVDEFAKKYGQEVFITPGTYPTWYFRK